VSYTGLSRLADFKYVRSHDQMIGPSPGAVRCSPSSGAQDLLDAEWSSVTGKEVVPALVEVEVAVPRSMPSLR